MSDEGRPISLEQVRRDREGKPDEAHVCVVAEGGKPVVYYEYEVSFTHDDNEYGFTIWAKDAADAEARLSSLRQSAMVGGQLITTVRP